MSQTSELGCTMELLHILLFRPRRTSTAMRFRGRRNCTLSKLNICWCILPYVKYFPKQVYLWGSILEKNRLDTLVGALGLVGRGFGPAGRAGLGWAWGLAVLGFGHAGRAGWVGRAGRAGWLGVGMGFWARWLGWACWACWARWLGWAWCWAWGLAVLGALGWVGRGVWRCWARWLGWAWCSK